MQRYATILFVCYLSLFCFVLVFCLPSILFWLLECIVTDCNFYFMALLVKVCMKIFNLFTRGAPKKSQELVQKCPSIPGSNWNLEMLVFEERGKPEYLEKNLSEQSGEATANSTQIWRRVRKSNPGHIGQRRPLLLLPYLCSLP